MIIANPIYDTAFKYLMEDTNIAMGIISRIIGQKIIQIDFKPQEYTIFTSKNELSFIRMAAIPARRKALMLKKNSYQEEQFGL